MIHPGIEAIQSTLAYFRLHGIKTKVIGSGFRSVSLWLSHQEIRLTGIS